jgi:hypothetical protein
MVDSDSFQTLASPMVTKLIKKETNTLFRQHEKPLDGNDIYFGLDGTKWKNGKESRIALVFFSRGSKHLVVIPESIVDSCIFYPIFETNGEEYHYKLTHKRFSYSKGRISIKFKIQDDFLLTSIRIKTNDPAVKELPLLKLPRNFWPVFDFHGDDIVSEIIKKISALTDSLVDGNGVQYVGTI